MRVNLGVLWNSDGGVIPFEPVEHRGIRSSKRGLSDSVDIASGDSLHEIWTVST